MVSLVKKIHLAEWAILLVGCVWVAALYSPILMHPDHYMFSDTGDGIKNYFTFAYHVRHSNNWIQFDGMNFPYGEHVTYTDGHALFSLLFGWIPWVQQYPVGFINILLLCSIPITGWLLYRLLRQNNVSHWVAAAGALAINWMNPQVFRLEGHLALSYAFILPLSFLLVTRWLRNDHWMNAMVYIVYAIMVFLIHPYLGLMTTMVAASAGVLSIIQWKFKRNLLWNIGLFALPVLVYWFFVKVTDTHLNRASDAKGFLTFSSSYESFFVPHHPPFRHLVSQIIQVHQQEWEGWAYLGITVILIVLLTLLLRSRRLILFFKEKTEWISFWLIALFSALLACAFPFHAHPEWLERIPFLEQFRSPGRFSWILFYTSSIFAWMLLDKVWLSTFHTLRWKMAGILLPLALALAEGWLPQIRTSESIKYHPNHFNKRNLTQEHLRLIERIQTSSPHCLLPLPFFHFGSDYYNRFGTDEAQKLAYTISFHTGIPLFASSNPRVSLDESQLHLNFFSNISNEKEILSDCDSLTSFYVLTSSDPLLDEEQWFADLAVPVVSRQQLMEATIRMRTTLLGAHPPADSVLVVRANGERTVPLLHAGDTLKAADTRFYEVIAELPMGFAPNYDTLQASVRLSFDALNAIYTSFIVERVEGEKVFYVDQCPVSHAVDHIKGGVWLKLQFPYDARFKYRFFLKGSDDEWATYAWKDLLVYPERSFVLVPEADGPDFRLVRR